MNQDPNQLTFLEHLDELRSRLIRSLACVLVTGIGAFVFKEELFELYKRPLLPLLEKNPNLLVVLSPIEPFLVYIKISAVTGIFIGLPFLLRELWAFLVPALSRDEKRASLPFLLAGTLCFMGGVLFCYFLVLPAALTVLHGLLPPAVHASYSMALFFNFITAMLLAFGLAFDLPVLMVLLAKLGILHPAWLARYRQYVVVGLFVLAAMVTPPDPFTQVAMALPLWLLFEIGLVISRLVIVASPVPPPTVAAPKVEENHESH
ncbi:MAG: twin-arginine translocase subunit TatC [Myxococcota bacterium]|nr:twin-arginine translocase subunit TatC [Myxococcales bacterium]MBF93627.1 twin-arginine translocase subunit TatC [Myxococcales bacterium]MEC7752342.1 twin-arginine translocase subunit TatC [Myxococcota bacterium]HBU49162.1 twin-arginine translocase subunit TatC [Myxococcales bacterium]